MKRVCLLFFLLIPSASAGTFAQLALGGGYRCTLIVTNKTSFAWSGGFKLYQGSEQKWAGQWKLNGRDLTGTTGFPVSLPPKGTQKLVLEGDSTTKSGYLEYLASGSSSSLDVAISYFYSYFSADGKLIDTVGSPESDCDTKFIFGVEKSNTIDTGFAWSPWIVTSPFGIILTLIDGQGIQSQQKQFTYDGHKAAFVSQIFGGMPDDFVGQVLVESQSNICLTILRIDYSDGGIQLTSVPPDSYIP